MHLKSIDIVGYKSFAVKTHLDFSPGITGIVGPNGCGKSNIMESVRWCLGEMSYKSLRADAMIEVIFSGTERRPPLSLTEVTLTFDNSSSQLPTQFSEVTVTRRIYRSGESAYFLNRTQCRLRDIREMFLDTGVGGEGYAIIDQGGVEFILRAKPEERRALFEEAAGVSKYKAKREEALRKLDRVEMDVARLQDSLSLIDEQVRNLDTAARKAKLYKKYEEELVGLEAAKTLAELAGIETHLADIGAKAGPAQERLDARRAAVGGEEAEVARLELEKTSRQAELTEIGNKISELKGETGKLDERCRATGAAITGFDERRVVCDKELEQARGRLGEIDPQIEQAGVEVDRVRGELEAAQKELADWQAQVDAGTAVQDEADKAFGQRQREVMKATEAARDARRQVGNREGALGHQSNDASLALRTLQGDLTKEAASREALTAVRAEVETQAASLAAAQEKEAAAKAELEGLRQRQAGLSDEVMHLHADLSGTKARAESLEAQGGQNLYWVGAQAVLNAGIDGVVGSVRSLIKVDEAWRPYVEDLLGERLYAVVCETSAAARAGVELLQAAGSGRARFLVLSTLSGSAEGRVYPEEARPLLQHVQFEPQHEPAVRFLFAECYTLGKVLFGDHWVCGGAQPGPGVQLSLSDIEDLRGRLSGLEAQAAQRETESALCKEQVAMAQSAWQEALSAKSSEIARAEALARRLKDAEQALESARQGVGMGTEHSAGILRGIALVKEELLGLCGRQAEAEALELAARQAETAAMGVLQAAKDALSEQRSRQNVLKERHGNLTGMMSIHATAFERLADNKKHLEATVAERGQELTDLARRRQEAVTSQDQSRQQMQVLQSDLSQQENAAAAARARLYESEQGVHSRGEALLGLKADSESAQAEVHGLEIQKSRLQASQETLRSQLWDQRQLTVEDAKTKFGTVAADPEKLETLRRRIQNMGPINLAAPEEYETLAQKQSFLNAQIGDLTQAKNDLKTAIQKINATTRENFRQTFADTREHFRRLYGVLFDGGEADLVLTNPDDILETGVEIVAQPPGKRLQSISLLSGGEKTMTAIALLFAFFMVRPSPFCMLDEADAALDDANINRFVNMLREFGTRTQFLIISPNKNTMEAADRIYGVTMEEKGVSQIVSIEFQKRGNGPGHAVPTGQASAAPVPAFESKELVAEPALATAPAAPEAPAAPAAEEPAAAPPLDGTPA